MKTLHLASIVLLSAATAFACSDDDDNNNTTESSAGAKSEAGAAGHDGVSAGGSDGEGGTPSGSSGETSTPVGGNSAAGSDGDAGGAGGVAAEPFELIGEYDGGLDGPIVITADSWNSSGILEYDNALNVVYTQYPDDNEYTPSKYAKFVYLELEDASFYFCTIVYAADTLADAKADETVADDSDPESGGCNTFPWSKAVPE